MSYFVVIRQRPHFIWEIWKRSFLSAVKPTVYSDPSQKRSYSRTLVKPKEDESRFPRCFAREIDRFTGNSKELEVVDANFVKPEEFQNAGFVF